MPGFPSAFHRCRETFYLGKMTKNCMKITKSTFLGQSSGELLGGGTSQFFSSWGDPPQSLSTRENPGHVSFIKEVAFC